MLRLKEHCFMVINNIFFTIMMRNFVIQFFYSAKLLQFQENQEKQSVVSNACHNKQKNEIWCVKLCFIYTGWH